MQILYSGLCGQDCHTAASYKTRRVAFPADPHFFPRVNGETFSATPKMDIVPGALIIFCVGKHNRQRGEV